MRFIRVALMLLIAVPCSLRAQSLDDAIRMLNANRSQEAKPILLAIAAREPDNARAQHYAGRVLLVLDDAGASIKYLERAVRKEPNNSEYQLWLGRGYGSQAEDANVVKQPGLAKKTKNAFDRALALDPENLDARRSLIDYYLIAPGFLGGDKKKALEQANEILKRDKWRGYQALALVQVEMENLAGAEQTMTALMRAFPDSSSPRIQLAIRQQETRRYDDAYETIKPLLGRTPVNMATLYQVGRISAMSGANLERGEAALRSYLTLTPGPGDPGHGAAHWRLGMVAEHRGNKIAARTEYETAIRLDPKLTQAKDALKKLR